MTAASAQACWVEAPRGFAYSSLMPLLTASVWIMVLSLTLWAGNYFLFDDVLGAEETAVVVFLVALVLFAVRFFWERVNRRKGKA